MHLRCLSVLRCTQSTSHCCIAWFPRKKKHTSPSHYVSSSVLALKYSNLFPFPQSRTITSSPRFAYRRDTAVRNLGWRFETRWQSTFQLYLRESRPNFTGLPPPSLKFRRWWLLPCWDGSRSPCIPTCARLTWSGFGVALLGIVMIIVHIGLSPYRLDLP